ncbi:MAG: thioredoxin-dependent thiol peroxidase [Defluviitaleaceae bacterium]|nr:thioredoxin-dependent thiol peroxidase [Defluviitaleaceae bacterium]
MLTVGEQAPLHIALAGSDGKKHTLGDFKGQKVVLFFYPKDNTPGCTTEAKSISCFDAEFKEMAVKVIGVSPDTVEKHQRFIDKHELKPLLLADPEKQLAEGFGVWGLKNNFGKTYLGLIRTTFVLDETGTIINVFDKVKTKTHGEDVLTYLKSI